MDNLHIEQTLSTPSIISDFEKGILEIKGESYPENINTFYNPLMCYIKEYLQKPQKKTTVILELTYFNSISSKLLYSFFDLLEEASNQLSIDVIWRYDEENESIAEAGEDFAEDLKNLNFKLLKFSKSA